MTDTCSRWAVTLLSLQGLRGRRGTLPDVGVKECRYQSGKPVINLGSAGGVVYLYPPLLGPDEAGFTKSAKVL